MLPKISIVTTCLNAEATIETTIKSVLAQNYSNMEYVIADGGSQDKTLEIIGRYKKNLAKVSSQKDRGISDGFNKGIELTSGELIWIINADDQLAPDAVKKVADCYLARNQPDIIYGNLLETKEGTERLVIPRSHNHLKEGMVISHPSTIIKKSVYDELGLYSLDYKISMDHHFCLKAFLAGKKFVYLNEVLARFSAEGVSNISLKNKVRVFTESYKAQKELGVPLIPSTLFLIKKVAGAYIKNWRMLF
ncbi:MAG: glycosyltransferase [Bdellovibrionaceae bacterium]|nr:glycosyltransferase [Pseudobdellovibrionaceae bacterium]